MIFARSGVVLLVALSACIIQPQPDPPMDEEVGDLDRDLGAADGDTDADSDADFDAEPDDDEAFTGAASALDDRGPTPCAPGAGRFVGAPPFPEGYDGLDGPPIGDAGP